MTRYTAIRLEGDADKDEDSRFEAFRSELESGARRVRSLFAGIASVVLLLLWIWLRP